MPELNLRPIVRSTNGLQVVAGKPKVSDSVPTIQVEEEIAYRFAIGQQPREISRGLRLSVDYVNDAIRAAHEIQRRKLTQGPDRRFRQQDHEIRTEVWSEIRQMRRAA
jgi:hypothetical protein